jgi:hypothetical protein
MRCSWAVRIDKDKEMMTTNVIVIDDIHKQVVELQEWNKTEKMSLQIVHTDWFTGKSPFGRFDDDVTVCEGNMDTLAHLIVGVYSTNITFIVDQVFTSLASKTTLAVRNAITMSSATNAER